MKRQVVLLPLAVAALLAAAVYSEPTSIVLGQPAAPPARPGDLGTAWSEPEPLPGAAAVRPGGPAGNQAVFSDWWKLAFQSYRDNNWEIYLSSGNGGTETRLTDHTSSDIHPRLNRGCTRIAFASKRDGDYEIWTMNVDGSGLAMLTSNTDDDVMPAWSYDGTRIAFQSYRDGQAEVYVMGADGLDQVRLTADPSYDGEPSFSPDGSQIAFTSSRSGDYGIWAMDAGGSGAVQLSAHSWGEHPGWSPDGQWIAYDADPNSDGFQEMWLMASDGSGKSELRDPSTDTDIWMRSWSPTAGHIAFTEVDWIWYGGQWYWTSGYLGAVDTAGSGFTALSSSGVDWNPDWQSADIIPPTSSVAELPATSPSRFTVSWSGDDSGGSGTDGFDVQVREGSGGAWTEWYVGTHLLSGTMVGQGGQSYYFRCRARDGAGNTEDWPAGYDAVTTVETLAPVTAVEALPALSPHLFVVRWGGEDPGGSGVANFDVQYRAGASGAWVTWKSGVAGRSAVMDIAVAGLVYYFRSRGTDGAGNVESWPSGDGDSSTTVYLASVAGTVRDNSGGPVCGAAVDTTPDPMAAFPSDREGAYRAYIGPAGDFYDATVSKAVYEELPPTMFETERDTAFGVVLPPADNEVADWGFESGALPPFWLPGGVYQPSVDAGARHTGAYGALLGLPITWQPAYTFVTGHDHPLDMALGLDAGGTVHIVWNDWDADLVQYRQRRPGGDWSAVETAYTFPGEGSLAQMAVDDLGTAHVVWLERGSPGWSIYYTFRSADGAWSTPQAVAAYSELASDPTLVVTPDRVVHVVWSTFDPYKVVYSRRDPDGSWSTPATIIDGIGSSLLRLAAGGDGSVHVAVSRGLGITTVSRDPEGHWSDPEELASSWFGRLALVADGAGTAHATWWDWHQPLQYARRSPGGRWSVVEDISDGLTLAYNAALAVGRQGTVHALWQSELGTVYHAWQQGSGPWSAPAALGQAGGLSQMALAVDPEGSTYAAWSSIDGGLADVRASRWLGDTWDEPVNLWQGGGSQPVRCIALAADGTGGAHVVWGVNTSSHRLSYSGTGAVGADGDALLSQAVAVPAGVPSRLSFLYRLSGASEQRSVGLVVRLDDGSSPVDLLETYSGTAGWQPASLDLTPWSGQTVSLTFATHLTAGAAPPRLELDEVTVGRAYPGVWVRLGGASAAPGGQATLALTYGNRGGAPAASAVLTATLPAGLTFVSADPPPGTVEPCLTWQVGELLVGAGPFMVALRVAVSPDLSPGAVLAYSGEIGSSSLELELLDNRDEAELWVGFYWYLPLVSRAE